MKKEKDIEQLIKEDEERLYLFKKAMNGYYKFLQKYRPEVWGIEDN